MLLYMIFFFLLWSDSRLWSWLLYLVELAVWALVIFGTIVCFDLQLDPQKNGVSSRTGVWAVINTHHMYNSLFNLNLCCPGFAAFTYHQFHQFLKSITIPCVWIGVLSLTWEMTTAMFRSVFCL